jgi:hypothetical protein
MLDTWSQHPRFCRLFLVIVSVWSVWASLCQQHYICAGSLTWYVMIWSLRTAVLMREVTRSIAACTQQHGKATSQSAHFRAASLLPMQQHTPQQAWLCLHTHPCTMYGFTVQLFHRVHNIAEFIRPVAFQFTTLQSSSAQWLSLKTGTGQTLSPDTPASAPAAAPWPPERPAQAG